MTQLESLTAFITANMPERAMTMFQSSMDDCELTPALKGLGLDQKRIGYLRYSAVLSWDDYPYRLCSPAQLYALVLAWIVDHSNALYDELKLTPPTVDPEFIDESTAMVQIAVPVADEIILRQSPDGEIPQGGKRWSVVYPEVWTAEQVEVIPQRGKSQ